MALLSASDRAAVLGFLELAAANEGPDPVMRAALAYLGDLIPSDLVEYFELGPGCPDPPYIASRDEDVSDWIEEADPWFFQNPMAACRFSPADGAVRQSQVISRHALEQLALYHTYLKPAHIDDVLKLWIPGGVDRCVCVQLSREGAPYSDRDEAILASLQNHFARLREAALARRTVAAHALLEPITPREAEILSLVAAGNRNQEIAGLLFIAPGTVRKHLEHIYDKLEVRSRAEAVARWLSLGSGSGPH